MPRPKLTLKEMHSLAKSRGGQCLSTEYVNAKTKLKWRCYQGHEWDAPANRIKGQGCWCPVCGIQRMRRSLTRDPEHVLKVINEEYPRFPRKTHDRRRKLTDEQIEEIQALRKKGYSLLKIAKRFGVSHQTVMYHTNPERRKRINRLAYLSLKEKLTRDPELREKMRQARVRYVEERLSEKGFRRYFNKVRSIRGLRNYYLKRGRIPLR